MSLQINILKAMYIHWVSHNKRAWVLQAQTTSLWNPT